MNYNLLIGRTLAFLGSEKYGQVWAHRLRRPGHSASGPSMTGVPPSGSGLRPDGLSQSSLSQAEPLVPNAEFAPIGWVSADLARAYFAIERAEMELAQPPDSTIGIALSNARAAIENADCELEKAR